MGKIASSIDLYNQPRTARPPVYSSVYVNRIGPNTFIATIENYSHRAEVLVVDVSGDAGGTSTPNHFVYPRMFPFFEDGIVVFCNEKCQPEQLAFCLHSFFENYGRLPRTRRDAIVGHIITAVFPKNREYKEDKPKATSDDDVVVGMDIEE